jgi:2-C-methyl-D-erythritol 4-phosphate cytidylyltransferase/2-C-methyl-D-erythritol 2,4-cyclodiphosphate synthase
MQVAAIIVAAGRGSRAGEGPPKQYRLLGGEPVLARTLTAFLQRQSIERIIVVIHPDDEALYEACIAGLPRGSADRFLPRVLGGETRQDSVMRGLEMLDETSPAIVLVHDAARPFVDGALIDRAVAAARAFGAAVPGIPVTDTIKVVDADGMVVKTPERRLLRAVQTPQAFRFDLLLAAHRKAAAAGLRSFTDDGALAEWSGLPVQVFEGDPANVKLTRQADFAIAERHLKAPSMTYVTRMGTGFDVHAFTEGDHVWLGGIRVPHRRGVEAHSDGDVILHALTDAILGALADGDIGVHFPPSDPQWRGASSDRFLAHAAERVRARAGFIDHLDATLLCEAPRLGPYREGMRRRIAEIAGLRVDQVSLKATTTERLGFTGRGEGLAAQAAATIRLPEASP